LPNTTKRAPRKLIAQAAIAPATKATSALLITGRWVERRVRKTK
jgi:hypothetical protein